MNEHDLTVCADCGVSRKQHMIHGCESYRETDANDIVQDVIKNTAEAMAAVAAPGLSVAATDLRVGDIVQGCGEVLYVRTEVSFIDRNVKPVATLTLKQYQNTDRVRVLNHR